MHDLLLIARVVDHISIPPNRVMRWRSALTASFRLRALQDISLVLLLTAFLIQLWLLARRAPVRRAAFPLSAASPDKPHKDCRRKGLDATKAVMATGSQRFLSLLKSDFDPLAYMP